MVARASMHDGAWSVISHRYRANAAHAKKRGSKSRALPATTESRSVDRRAVDACTHRHAFVATGNHLDLNAGADGDPHVRRRSEEHTSELQSLMRISYAVFCLKKKI